MTDEIRKLRDPVAVHVAMLRGEIAIPPLAELLHVYGATFNDLDAANIELAKARETIGQLRAQLAKAESTVAFEQSNLKHQSQRMAELRAQAVEDAIKVVVERNAQLDEIAELRAELVRKADELRAHECASVVAVIEQINLGAGVTYLSVAPKTPLPPAGTEPIARPARKGE